MCEFHNLCSFPHTHKTENTRTLKQVPKPENGNSARLSQLPVGFTYVLHVRSATPFIALLYQVPSNINVLFYF